MRRIVYPRLHYCGHDAGAFSECLAELWVVGPRKASHPLGLCTRTPTGGLLVTYGGRVNGAHMEYVVGAAVVSATNNLFPRLFDGKCLVRIVAPE